MAPISDCKAVTNIQGEVRFFTPLPSDFFLWVTGLSEETQGLCYRISSSSETQMLKGVTLAEKPCACISAFPPKVREVTQVTSILETIYSTLSRAVTAHSWRRVLLVGGA